MNAYAFLFLAIVSEVIGTSALKPSEGFTKMVPSTILLVAYGCSFYFLSRCLEHIPVGVAYATWSGAGTALIVLIGYVVFRQKVDAAGLLGIALIVAGVIVLHGFSASSKI